MLDCDFIEGYPVIRIREPTTGVEVWAIVDSGGGVNLVPPNFIFDVQRKGGNVFEVGATRLLGAAVDPHLNESYLIDIEIGKIKFEQAKVTARDLGEVAPYLAGVALLGHPVLRHSKLEIDWPGEEISLSFDQIGS